MAEEPQLPPTIDLDSGRLRPLRVADADALYAYLRDPVITELTGQPHDFYVYALLRSDCTAQQAVGVDEVQR